MKRLALFFLTIMLISVNVSANTSFGASESGKPYIEEAVDCGVIAPGDLNNLQNEITREEVCEIMVDMLKSQLPEVDCSIKFDDTDNESVEYLYNLGIVNGKGENKFYLDDTLTREQLAKIAVNLYIEMHPNYEIIEYDVRYFDEHKTSPWALEYVEKAMGIGVMEGIYNGEFRLFYANSNVTKEEVVATAFRLYNMRMTDGTLAIPDEETALKMGKILLEKYSGKQMEYTTDTRIYYLEAYYSDDANAWSISQNYKYKNPDWKWGGSGIKVPYVVLSESTGGLMFINTASDIEDAGVPYFSYEDILKKYKESQPGVRFGGFKNTEESGDYIRTAEKAIELAKAECTVEYDTVSVRYDEFELVWEVCFYKELTDGGDQTVYIGGDHCTLLIVSGE